MSDRPCTCHPDDNPPVPCPQKYALSECRAAAPAPDPYFLGLARTLLAALKRLSFAAQTACGTAGRDDELVAAIAQAENAIKEAHGRAAAPAPEPPLYSAPPAVQGEPATTEQKLMKAGVYAGMGGLRGLAKADEFWADQPYGTRLYYGPGNQYLHRSVLETAIELLDAAPPAVQAEPTDQLIARLRSLASELDADDSPEQIHPGVAICSQAADMLEAFRLQRDLDGPAWERHVERMRLAEDEAQQLKAADALKRAKRAEAECERLRRAYKYTQERLESIGYHGWAHDYDAAIAQEGK